MANCVVWRRMRRRRALLAVGAVVAGACLIVSLAVYREQHNVQAALYSAKLNGEAVRGFAQLREQLKSLSNAVNATWVLAEEFSDAHAISLDKWQAIRGRLESRLSGVAGVSTQANVTASGRAAWEAAVSAAYGFTVVITSNTGGALPPGTTGPQLWPLEFATFVGRDLWTDPTRRAAIERALEAHVPVGTPLLSSFDSEDVFLVFAPLRRRGSLAFVVPADVLRLDDSFALCTRVALQASYDSPARARVIGGGAAGECAAARPRRDFQLSLFDLTFSFRFVETDAFRSDNADNSAAVLLAALLVTTALVAAAFAFATYKSGLEDELTEASERRLKESAAGATQEALYDAHALLQVSAVRLQEALRLGGEGVPVARQEVKELLATSADVRALYELKKGAAFSSGLASVHVPDTLRRLLRLFAMVCSSKVVVRAAAGTSVGDLVIVDERKLRFLLMTCMSYACQLTQSGLVTVFVTMLRDDLIVAVADFSATASRRALQGFFAACRDVGIRIPTHGKRQSLERCLGESMTDAYPDQPPPEGWDTLSRPHPGGAAPTSRALLHQMSLGLKTAARVVGNAGNMFVYPVEDAVRMGFCLQARPWTESCGGGGGGGGGEAKAESQPVAEESAPDTTANQDPPSFVFTAHSAPFRVFAIVGDTALHHQLETVLRRLGVAVAWFESDAALPPAHLRSFHAGFLSVLMSARDGRDMARRLSLQPDCPRLFALSFDNLPLQDVQPFGFHASVALHHMTPSFVFALLNFPPDDPASVHETPHLSRSGPAAGVLNS